MRLKQLYQAGRHGLSPCGQDNAAGSGWTIALIGAAVAIAAGSAYTIGRLERYYREASAPPKPAGKKAAPKPVEEVVEDMVDGIEGVFDEIEGVEEEVEEAPETVHIEEAPEDPAEDLFFEEEAVEESPLSGDVPRDWYFRRS